MKKYIAIGVFVALFSAGCGDDPQPNTSGGGKSAGEESGEQFVKIGADVAAGYATILFDFDKYDIRSDMDDKVQKSALALKSTGAKVVLEGHTDAYGSDAYNFTLGTKRANAVKKALVAQGVSSSQLSTVSYGESKPTCTEDTESCRQENRRVEFKLAQ